MALFYAWAFGFLVVFGVNGFAYVTDVQSVVRQNQQIQLAQVDNEILEARHQQCLAIGEGNNSAMIYNERRLNEKLSTYRVVSGGRDYPRVPECSELVSAVPSIPIYPPATVTSTPR